MLTNKVRQHANTNRSFLTGDIVWGVKQQHIQKMVVNTLLHNKIYDGAGYIGRRLSENPSTYLR